MQEVLREFLDDFVVVYLDDIVIYSKDMEEHIKHLKKPNCKDKCEFGLQEVGFLGHVVGNGKIKMEAGKIKAIVDWETPKSASELRSFLGLVNYYRRFIKGHSVITAPLTNMPRKDKDAWEWTQECMRAFEQLKEAVTKEPVLALPDFTKPFEVMTDASDIAVVSAISGTPIYLLTVHPFSFRAVLTYCWIGSHKNHLVLRDVVAYN
ncbi:uncharacterized mitochondrial protein AtMg00860-like [Andrographis paniculata]|uniref:uncharacterized mitochondrial protein AtMg00860-like n=1 Tax=Andrographis paniculata TaxID=175694 RepID=UPI0021E8AC03|nr:uncharacterized mitochondrial protein AtMg00860-like [Andrographis paniculata]